MLHPAVARNDTATAARRSPSAVTAFEEADTLHELFGYALDDLQAILANPRYRVDMRFWHMPALGPIDGGNPCRVCAAGAVMANRYRCDPKLGDGDILSLGLFPKDQVHKLIVINDLRCGRVCAAYRDFYGLNQTVNGRETAARVEKEKRGFLNWLHEKDYQKHSQISTEHVPSSYEVYKTLRELHQALRRVDL